jgi:hypothetical protein
LRATHIFVFTKFFLTSTNYEHKCNRFKTNTGGRLLLVPLEFLMSSLFRLIVLLRTRRQISNLSLSFYLLPTLAYLTNLVNVLGYLLV